MLLKIYRSIKYQIEIHYRLYHISEINSLSWGGNIGTCICLITIIIVSIWLVNTGLTFVFNDIPSIGIL